MPHQDKDSERAKFEAWASEPHREIDMTPNIHSSSRARYTSVETNVLFEGWMARASLTPQSTQGAEPADAQDAKRYRWLRDESAAEHADNNQPFIASHYTNSWGNNRTALLETDEADAAIDAAMLSTK